MLRNLVFIALTAVVVSLPQDSTPRLTKDGRYEILPVVQQLSDSECGYFPLHRAGMPLSVAKCCLNRQGEPIDQTPELEALKVVAGNHALRLAEQDLIAMMPKELDVAPIPNKQVNCVVLQAPNLFFDLISYVRDRKLKERNSRPLFHQIAQGLRDLHAKGFAYRGSVFDALISNGNVMLTDFIHACRLTDPACKAKGYSHANSAPETSSYSNVVIDDPTKIDVYQLGKLLDFYSEHPELTTPLFTTDSSFRELVGRMMSKNPASRPGMDEVVKHPWWTSAA